MRATALALALAISVLRAPMARAEHVYAGFGMLAHNMWRTSTSEIGGKGFFGTTYPALTLSGRVPAGAGVDLAPWVGYTFISRELTDQRLGFEDRTSTSLIAVGLPLAFRGGSSEIRAGFGMLFYKISGQGGQVDVVEGASMTTYSLPNRSASSRSLFVDLGAGYYFWRLRADIELMVTGLFSERRALSSVLSVSYGVF